TSAWWKEERHGVFVDYNQNARDRTVASAFSVRPTGLVSTPLTWEEVRDADPRDFPMDRFVARYEAVGDLTAGIDEAVGDLEGLLELARRDEEGGLGDAPWPPHFPKQDGEPVRAQPSRRRRHADGS
ncbi:MAG: ATP-dependent DNA ligase, partial [Actinomycetota bacterium]|nr:ATP-dependent DNA ligase [Actinomycetota bacterium]